MATRKKNKTKNNIKLIYFLEILLVVGVFFVGFFGFVNRSIQNSKEKLYKERETEDVDSSLKKNVEVKLIPTKTGDIYAHVINNNDIPTSVIVDVVFYDEKDKQVGEATAYALQTAPNHDVYEEVLLEPDEYDHYDFSYKVSSSFLNKYMFENIEISAKRIEKYLEYSITNNNDEPIRVIDGVIIYYLNDEIVALNSLYTTYIKAGETKTETKLDPYRYVRSDYTTIPIEYDTWTIHINEAYGYEE